MTWTSEQFQEAEDLLPKLDPERQAKLRAKISSESSEYGENMNSVAQTNTPEGAAARGAGMLRGIPSVTMGPADFPSGLQRLEIEWGDSATPSPAPPKPSPSPTEPSARPGNDELPPETNEAQHALIAKYAQHVGPVAATSNNASGRAQVLIGGSPVTVPEPEFLPQRPLGVADWLGVKYYQEPTVQEYKGWLSSEAAKAASQANQLQVVRSTQKLTPGQSQVVDAEQGALAQHIKDLQAKSEDAESFNQWKDLQWAQTVAKAQADPKSPPIVRLAYAPTNTWGQKLVAGAGEANSAANALANSGMNAATLGLWNRTASPGEATLAERSQAANPGAAAIGSALGFMGGIPGQAATAIEGAAVKHLPALASKAAGAVSGAAGALGRVAPRAAEALRVAAPGLSEAFPGAPALASAAGNALARGAGAGLGAATAVGIGEEGQNALGGAGRPQSEIAADALKSALLGGALGAGASALGSGLKSLESSAPNALDIQRARQAGMERKLFRGGNFGKTPEDDAAQAEGLTKDMTGPEATAASLAEKMRGVNVASALQNQAEKERIIQDYLSTPSGAQARVSGGPITRALQQDAQRYIQSTGKPTIGARPDAYKRLIVETSIPVLKNKNLHPAEEENAVEISMDDAKALGIDMQSAMQNGVREGYLSDTPKKAVLRGRPGQLLPTTFSPSDLAATNPGGRPAAPGALSGDRDTLLQDPNQETDQLAYPDDHYVVMLRPRAMGLADIQKNIDALNEQLHDLRDRGAQPDSPREHALVSVDAALRKMRSQLPWPTELGPKPSVAVPARDGGVRLLTGVAAQLHRVAEKTRENVAGAEAMGLGNVKWSTPYSELAPAEQGAAQRKVLNWAGLAPPEREVLKSLAQSDVDRLMGIAAQKSGLNAQQLREFGEVTPGGVRGLVMTSRGVIGNMLKYLLQQGSKIHAGAIGGALGLPAQSPADPFSQQDWKNLYIVLSNLPQGKKGASP